MNRELVLRRRIRSLTWLFILGLVVSGLTAMPLESELDWLASLLGLSGQSSEQVAPGFANWILRVRDALHETNAKFPFLAYGTDWLAFGHIIIAIAFVGALRDPVRNAWLFDFGLIACALVVPWALGCGAARGIPLGWQLIDCSFGVLGATPLWLCRRWTAELARLAGRSG